MRIPVDAKLFIVQALARFETPQRVAEALGGQFGIAMSRQAIEAYDPTKYAGRTLSKRWRAIFEESRTEFISNLAEIGIAHRAVRLRRIQSLADQAQERGNYKAAAKLLQLAAEEVGNMFADRQRASMPSSAVEIRRS